MGCRPGAREHDHHNRDDHAPEAVAAHAVAALRPMLATASSELPPDDGAWVFEMKWDGVRALLFAREGRLQVLSRAGNDATARYQELGGLAVARQGLDAVLDGEIVVLDDAGVPRFEALQRHDRGAVVMLFDLLELGGESLLDRPYRERRAELEALALDGAHWRTPLAHRGRGVDAYRTASELGLEGVVAKRLDSRYEPGRRSAAWRKVKVHAGQEVVVGGWLPGNRRLEERLGSLLVGVHDGVGGPLQYAGRVGSGITESTRVDLERLLEPRRQTSRPFADDPRVRGAIWVRPDVVVEVRFTEWTRAGLLRQPTFRGLRDDKDPATVVREAAPGGS